MRDYLIKKCIHLSFKWSLTRDFRLQVFFMNQCPPGPQVFRWGRFEFFRKFAEMFANEYLSPVSMTTAINCSAETTTPVKNLSPVLLTPAINLCHGEITKKPKIYAGVNDTAEKLFTGVNDFVDKLFCCVNGTCD
jgi:hypothetical protein